MLLNKNVFAVGSGRYFILTLPNFTKESEYFTWLSKTKPAGVMLLSCHIKNRDQVKKLCSILQNYAKQLKIFPLIISIDWEGGIISRPSEDAGFTSVPSPYNLARAGRTCCFLAGKLIGQQLRSVGVNIDFAPSVDLFDKENYVLATRCFSSDFDKITESGIAFSNGLLSEGVSPVIKHYPGLGLGKKDTHFSSVFINAKNDVFRKNEKPFIESIASGIPIIMVTHAQFSQFGKVPASRSVKVINYLKKRNPNLIVITDDIAMQSFHGDSNIYSAAVQSIESGFDFLIFSATARQQIDLIEKLDSHLNLKENLAKQRINELITKNFEGAGQVLNEKKVGNYLAKRALSKKIKPTDFKNKKCLMVSADVTKIRPDKWFIDSGKTITKKILEKEKIRVKEFILDAKNTKSLKTLSEIVSGDNFDYLILQTFFYGDGIWNQTQQQWLEFLKPYQEKLIIFSLGHPFEYKILPKAQCVELGSFHIPIVKQAVKCLTRPKLVTGADRLGQNLNLISDKRIGLLCHKCSVFRDIFLPDYLVSINAKLCAIFAPEHGILGMKPDGVLFDTEYRSRWGCPIYSFHGSTKSPMAEILGNLDLLMIDIQEVGVRCYTYLSTLALTLQAAAKSKVPVLLLERPNPIKFLGAQGPKLNQKFESFLGKIDSTFIHGLTIGQIAENLNSKIGADLKVLSYQGDLKSVERYFYSNFISPSPNLVNIDSVYDYPCTVFIEGTNYSEGRGTMHSFEQVGAPWVDSKKLAENLNAKKLQGVYFEPVSFTPKCISGMSEKPKHKDVPCKGIYVHVYDHKNIKPLLISKTILKELFQLYPKQSQWVRSGKRYLIDLLAGDDSVRREINI